MERAQGVQASRGRGRGRRNHHNDDNDDNGNQHHRHPPYVGLTSASQDRFENIWVAKFFLSGSRGCAFATAKFLFNQDGDWVPQTLNIVRLKHSDTVVNVAGPPPHGLTYMSLLSRD
eukprot:m.151930 g.151930  ORF g.151930 m.151930 type:complete len:117 (-) comp17427_c0_seq1:216-566(-)